MSFLDLNESYERNNYLYSLLLYYYTKMDEFLEGEQEEAVLGEEQQEQEQDAFDEEEDEEDDILDMGEDGGATEKEGLLMRFCPHDSSMLYPSVSSSSSSIGSSGCA